MAAFEGCHEGTGKRIGEAMGRLFAVAQSSGSGEIVTLQMESGDGLKEDFKATTDR